MTSSILVGKHPLFIALVAVLVLSGCQGGFNFGKREQPQNIGAFVGGTRGLEIGFADDEPPASVLDNGQEEFFVTLIMKNLGEYTIPQGGVIGSLSGIVKNTFGLKSLDAKNSVEIFGVTKEGNNVIPGGEEFLEFGTASFSSDLPADTQFLLKADACYAYQTQAVATVCLRKNVLQKEIGDVCNINNAALGEENSGAPMHVEGMKQSSVGTNKVKVTFKVVNKGIGAVYEPTTFTASCVGKEDQKNMVRVSVLSPSKSFTAECTQLGGGSIGVVKLINNQKDVTCTIGTTGLQDVTFQDLFIVQLDYMYRESIVTPLIVANAQ